MKEQAFRADAREAKGLHDGSITRVVRLPQLHDSNPGDLALPSYYNTVRVGMHCYDNDEPHAFGAMFHCDKGGEVFVESPFGMPSERLRAVCEPTDPCEHRGCLSHVTHVCEGCGRGHAGIFLDVTDVRVVRAQEVTGQDMRAAGMTFGCRWCTAADACAVREVCEHPRDEFRELVGRAVFDANRWLWLATVQKVD